MKLVGLAGPARCGKDTIGCYLMEEFGVYPVGYATALKEAAAILLNRSIDQIEGADGFDREAVLPEWGFSVREFLQKFGTECLRNVIREDFWINRVLVEIGHRDAVVITDVRFENEADFIREQGGTIWHISRGAENGLDDEAKAHASEAGVQFVIGADVFLTNDGTLDELNERVKNLWVLFE